MSHMGAGGSVDDAIAKLFPDAEIFEAGRRQSDAVAPVSVHSGSGCAGHSPDSHNTSSITPLCQAPAADVACTSHVAHGGTVYAPVYADAHLHAPSAQSLSISSAVQVLFADADSHAPLGTNATANFSGGSQELPMVHVYDGSHQASTGNVVSANSTDFHNFSSQGYHVGLDGHHQGSMNSGMNAVPEHISAHHLAYSAHLFPHAMSGIPGGSAHQPPIAVASGHGVMMTQTGECLSRTASSNLLRTASSNGYSNVLSRDMPTPMPMGHMAAEGLATPASCEMLVGSSMCMSGGMSMCMNGMSGMSAGISNSMPTFPFNRMPSSGDGHLSRTASAISRTGSSASACARLPSSGFARAGSGGFSRAGSGGFSRAGSGAFSRAGSADSHAMSSAGDTHLSRTASAVSDLDDREGADNCSSARGKDDNGTRVGVGSGVGWAQKRRPWSADEHARFLESLNRFGSRDKGEKGGRVTVGLGPGVAEVIAVVVGTRTVNQVRSHAQKYFLQLSRTGSTATCGGPNAPAPTCRANAGAGTCPNPPNPSYPSPTYTANTSAPALPERIKQGESEAQEAREGSVVGVGGVAPEEAALTRQDTPRQDTPRQHTPRQHTTTQPSPKGSLGDGKEQDVFVSEEEVCVSEQEVCETEGAVASNQSIKSNDRQEGAETCNKRPKLEKKLDSGRSRSSSPKMSLPAPPPLAPT